MCAASASCGAAGEEDAGAASESAGGALELVETNRGNYTFCRRYDRSRYKLVDECTGLHSIDMYENLGIVGRGAFNKIYKVPPKMHCAQQPAQYLTLFT